MTFSSKHKWNILLPTHLRRTFYQKYTKVGNGLTEREIYWKRKKKDEMYTTVMDTGQKANNTAIEFSDPYQLFALLCHGKKCCFVALNANSLLSPDFRICLLDFSVGGQVQAKWGSNSDIISITKCNSFFQS